MKRVIRTTLTALIIATLLPINNAKAQGIIIVAFSAEDHLFNHRCSTVKKVFGGGTCLNDADKQPATPFTFSASAKKPKKSGNTTSCFAVKVSSTAAKGGGSEVRGPMCDINLTGMAGKLDPALGNCEASTGPFAGTFAVYSDHAGDPLGKKLSNVVGTFDVRGGMGFATGSEKKKTKNQGSTFVSQFMITAQDLEKGDTDTLDDCFELTGTKDSPQQVGVDGYVIAVHEDQ